MSQLHASGYHIGGPTGVCAVTGRPLAVGEHFVAVLLESPENDELTRVDCCLEAWERGTRPPGLFGYWKGVVPEPNAKPKMIIDDEVVLDLFEQLAEQTDPKRIAFRFVLALILIRKRLLVCDETRRGTPTELPALLVRHKGTPRPPEGPPLLEVIDPGLDESSIEGIMEQFEAIVGGSLQPGGSPAAGPPSHGTATPAPSAPPAGSGAARKARSTGTSGAGNATPRKARSSPPATADAPPAAEGEPTEGERA